MMNEEWWRMMVDEWKMMKDEGWMMKDEGWWFQAVGGFCFMTDERTDICDCRVAFATENCIKSEIGIIYLTPLPPYLKNEKQKNEILVCLRPPSPPLRVKNLVVLKVYCNTFVVTFQCSETSLTSSESKQY